MADLGDWSPLPLIEATSILGLSDPSWWWIAGGYAIELFVGRSFRDHGDLDVLVMRRDQLRIQAAMDGWDLHVVDPPGELRPWEPGEWLDPPVHDIWGRRAPNGPWQIQFMLDEATNDDWHSRRSVPVTRPLRSLGYITADGWPVLSPEVQLFYKATGAEVRAKDQQDFLAAHPLLDRDARRWLGHALALTAPHHPWREALSSARTPT
jgi:hypothetical protein